ncbi:MerR family transcriptional regulator [Paenibacillus flagellatus]|uniref:MerR family transcriptional regulator n=1 Tax=Paenibacillus flagellatus TaxID=2211139 RepID=A0A2V5K027_9BACL|nr:MerR family transcriptional regulator [Paenibacillus flagellatus]PYI51902.1 MerR family transcriptional regulator [Paenibacillus flagellatus]
MSSYTAKQLTELVQKDDPDVNLRTVRYYTQIGLLPPLETEGSKRVYTDRHLHCLRAIRALANNGETLAGIRDKLNGLSFEEVTAIGDNLRLVRSDDMLLNETHRIGDDVILSIHPRVSDEVKAKMIETVSRLLKGDDR